MPTLYVRLREFDSPEEGGVLILRPRLSIIAFPHEGFNNRGKKASVDGTDSLVSL